MLIRKEEKEKLKNFFFLIQRMVKTELHNSEHTLNCLLKSDRLHKMSEMILYSEWRICGKWKNQFNSVQSISHV